MIDIPRPEHPRPGFMRQTWLNLNGEWEFCFDENLIGQQKHFENQHLDQRIIVPFCPESKLSGINNTDFHNCVWYRRDITIPSDWNNKRILLHFGAVDYEAYVYVNGSLVGTHKGGYTSFEFDITAYLNKQNNYISVCAIDDIRSGNYPSGKQCKLLNSKGCFYTRTTGIWQTVWLEAVPNTYLESIKIYPDVEHSSVRITFKKNGHENLACKVMAKYEGKAVGEATLTIDTLEPTCTIALSETHLWEVGIGGLYDIEIETYDDTGSIDSISSYFGLRSVSLDARAFYINNSKLFGRWVLDQGFYPDGIYTAPSDEDLKNDIILAQKLGFNGARLHQKVFEERFLYWADKLGYMVWGEYGNWGYTPEASSAIDTYLPEWLEVLDRDFNHPSIIGWIPFNETISILDCEFTFEVQNAKVVDALYQITKRIDTTRPCIDASGFFHKRTDIYDTHDYEPDPEVLAEHYAHIDEGKLIECTKFWDKVKDEQDYHGEPVFVSEYGGIGWSTDGNSWGYGNMPKTEAEFKSRYKGITEVLLKNKNMLGFCYTQLYDIEQEQNGLLTYDRKPKFDFDFFHNINTQIADIEK